MAFRISFVLLGWTLVACLASEPFTTKQLLDSLSSEGLAQFAKLSAQQKVAATTEMRTSIAGLEDAKSVRFSVSGKVRVAASLRCFACHCPLFTPTPSCFARSAFTVS
jgi:hypothetical protein